MPTCNDICYTPNKSPESFSTLVSPTYVSHYDLLLSLFAEQTKSPIGNSERTFLVSKQENITRLPFLTTIILQFVKSFRVRLNITSTEGLLGV